MKRMNQRKEEELIKRQTVERRNLPKRIRNEMKAREMMFRESMRISMSSVLAPDPDAEREKLKKFQENEKKRYRAEQQRFELKHSRQLEEVRAQSDATIKELEQLQNEKRKMLMEHETLKLKEQEEAYGREIREWKAQLKPRKQVITSTLDDVILKLSHLRLIDVFLECKNLWSLRPNSTYNCLLILYWFSDVLYFQNYVFIFTHSVTA